MLKYKVQLVENIFFYYFQYIFAVLNALRTYMYDVVKWYVCIKIFFFCFAKVLGVVFFPLYVCVN